MTGTQSSRWQCPRATLNAALRVALLPALVLLASHAAAAGPDEAEYVAAVNMARKFYQQGDYQQALPYYERAASAAIKAYGGYHTRTADVLEVLGICYKNVGRYEDSLKVHGYCLQARTRLLPPNDPKIAWCHNNFGRTYEAMGNLEQAAKKYQESLAIAESRGKDHVDVALPLQNLGNVYYRNGQYSLAEPLYRRSLAIREAKLGKHHPDTALSVVALANLHEDRGEYVEAEALFRRGLAIWEATRGPEHPDVALALHNLGIVYYDMGLYEKAEAVWRRALAIREKSLGSKHADVAQSLNSLANVYLQLGDTEKAAATYRHSANVYEAALGPQHPESVVPVENLGSMHVKLKQYKQAEELLKSCIARREDAQGKDHIDIARPLRNLAQLYVEQGEYSQSEPLFRRALEIREKSLGKDNPLVADIYYWMAVSAAAQEHWHEAGDLLDQARRIVRRHVVEILPMLSPDEQLTFLTREDHDSMAVSLTLGWLKGNDQALAQQSASWLLNGKGVAHEALAQRALLERDLTDPRRQAIAQQLQNVRERRAAVALAPPKPDQEAERARLLEQLKTQQHELEKQLVDAGAAQPARRQAWIELDEIRAALPLDSVLIDVARFVPRNFTATGDLPQWQPARYAAWIVPPAGDKPVQIVDLGEAEQIDAAVQACRSSMQRAIELIADEGEAHSERSARTQLEQLSKLSLLPILQHVGDARQLILSLDGQLWLVPWAALPLANGKYAIEDYQLRYLVSGRDLVAQEATSQDTVQPIIMADPNFDLGPQDMAAATQAVLRNAKPPSGRVLRSLAPDALQQVPKVARLPGTAAEAKAITPQLQAYAGTAPLLYTDRWALEGVFKAIKRPKLLTMSTHGFFLADEASPGQRVENPLLRCGLLLAGCNSRDAANAGGQDGVLTGLEIVGTDLRGTEMVVLSACETGLGQVHNGEGVAGLRQAFQLAGARSVVSTLWQIPDQESAELMTSFFTNLANGQSKPEALRSAQLSLISSRREQHGAAHPFFWAAFTFTGENTP